MGPEEKCGLNEPCMCFTLSGFKSFSLTSVELQMLTNSCVKLQTVHNIPLTINKEGESSLLGKEPRASVSSCWPCPPDQWLLLQKDMLIKAYFSLPVVGGTG